MRKFFNFPLILIFFINVLNVLDFVLTFIGINKFGIVSEGNPLMVYQIENFGWLITGFLKILICLTFSYVSYKGINYNNKTVKIVSHSFNIYLLFSFIIIVYRWSCVLI